MEYGCIGEVLVHSFSKEIHAKITDYDYTLMPIPKDKLDDFMRERDFKAINVTIPYKQAVIPHLAYLDEGAKKIGAVNTIVNRDGRLFGYNTDFFGMSAMINHMGLGLMDKKVLILGTGGTSKTARAVAESMGAKEIVIASRKADNGAVLYSDVYKYHLDSDIIINTTPVGMYPNIYNAPIDISSFTKLSGVVDAIYNPARTQLVSEAKRRGIVAEGGLYMLVAQAVRASEIFLDTVYPEGLIEQTYLKTCAEKENIILIGMPACGKSTVARILAERTGRKIYDTDGEITKREGKTAADIISLHGEQAFRDIESEICRSVASYSSAVIATGGGIILREENIKALRQNGKIYFLDRSPELLIPTSDRPLSSSREAIMKRYAERYEVYCSRCDVRINADGTPDEVAEAILTDFIK